MEAFDIKRLDAHYAFLDDLSDVLFPLVLDQLTGTLEDRTEAIAALQQALIKGKLPPRNAMPWPAQSIVGMLFDFLEDLRLAPLCEGQPELIEELMKSLLVAIRDFEKRMDSETLARLKELASEEEEKIRRSHAAAADATDTQDEATHDLVELPEELIEALRELALAEATRSARQDVIATLDDQWRERAEMWWEISEVFGQLSSLLGRGWSYARGLVRSQSWLELTKLRKLMEQLPELRELIATLGRMHVSDDDTPPVMEAIFATMRRSVEIVQDATTPLAPMETRGVRRSNDLSRLLPVEALNFTHPRLRTLFYARLHEHALATYLVEGVLPQRVVTETDIEESQERRAESPPKKRGPIIACLDTSGSMAGAPERIAKALVLEALRVAHEEDRPCYLIAFSGPDQTEAHELSLTPEGFQSLFAFFGRSFYGGTDLVAPLRKALKLLDDERWEKADILLVSDGEFPVPHTVEKALNTARKERGLQLHGVCVGHRSKVMEALCDEFHRFGEWEALRR